MELIIKILSFEILVVAFGITLIGEVFVLKTYWNEVKNEKRNNKKN